MRTVKLLCVVILGMVVGGAECAQQTVFDLPPNTPGLRNGNTQYKIVKGIQNQECVHVIVPGTDAERALKREYYDDAIEAMASNGSIYFPRNGTQPTTPEAVEYSCANIDNRENSPITEWYMKMFGVVPFRNTEDPANDYIKAGYDKNNNPCRIISYDFETMGTDEGYEDSYHIHHDTQREEAKRQTFITNFRKIASTSVGRVLLYRILIEIRRRDKTGNGCCESAFINMNNLGSMTERNGLRTICICYRGIIMLYKSMSSIWNIGISDTQVNSFVIGGTEQNVKYTNIVLQDAPVPLHINLFHEFCHWFHYLRDYNRTVQERTGEHLFKNEISRYLWRGLDVDAERIKVTASCWDGNEGQANIEEIRTILGSSAMICCNYLEGDDLCENLYRICIGCSLRYGHAGRGVLCVDHFFEDLSVTNKITCMTVNNISQYSWLFHPRLLENKTYPDYFIYNWQGLGAFKRLRPEYPKKDDSSRNSSYCSLQAIGDPAIIAKK